MPSSPEYRTCAGISTEAMTAAQEGHRLYSLTTATDPTEAAALIALIDEMKGQSIDVWSVLLSAATVPGPAFRSLI